MTVADVGVYSIAYEVQIASYSMPSKLTGTLAFEILCPPTVTSTARDADIDPAYQYDIAQSPGWTLQIPLPTITVTPSCITVTTFELTDSTDSTVSWITNNSPNDFSINTADTSKKGMHSGLKITAVLSNGDRVQQQTFNLEVIDSCEVITVQRSSDI